MLFAQMLIQAMSGFPTETAEGTNADIFNFVLRLFMLLFFGLVQHIVGLTYEGDGHTTRPDAVAVFVSVFKLRARD